MDFTFTTEAEEAAALAATILTDHTTPEQLAKVEAGGDRLDPVLWRALGHAGLRSLTTPEDEGGGGLGLVELCRVLVEVGRTVAPVPLASDTVARLFVAEHGTHEQRRLAAPTPDDGWGNVLSLAIAEEHEHVPTVPTTTATLDGAGYVLAGTKHLVPAATVASMFLVPATTPDGVVVFLVDAAAVGIREQRLSDGDVVGLLDLDDVQVPAERRVGSAGENGSAERLRDLATVATCAVQLGVTEHALGLTAQYASTREQFDRPIGSFQAVSQRLADGYIDTRLQALTLWQAAWRLQAGVPAEDAVATAKLWAADAGHRIAHTTVHVHGGVGIDLDGVPHRYFTAAKRLESEHGGATEQALRLGRLLAAGPA
ncbi:acyl-CoA dehydrogenase family protein [Aeromicrobium sp. CTD01-1L150]|uniref:acyl-CoA dehydrogenase family protein n=1 Tax=Aeromicrobium sp. CTD01-1L150 TaxID=3341830 RepID=UPI0035BF0FB3